MKKEDVNTILAEIHKIKSEERRHLSEINYKSILAGVTNKCSKNILLEKKMPHSQRQNKR